MSQQIVSYQIGAKLYLSITNRCTLCCQFCPKTQGKPTVQGHDLLMNHLPGIKEILSDLPQPAAYEEVVFCGFGEPTLRLQVLLQAARAIKERGGRVRVNTDGLANLVHRRNVLPELAPWVDALSVSLNAQDETTYKRHCQPALAGSYQAMLRFLNLSPRWIPAVTATAIEGLAGVDIPACEALAHKLGVGFRKRVLDQVG